MTFKWIAHNFRALSTIKVVHLVKDWQVHIKNGQEMKNRKVIRFYCAIMEILTKNLRKYEF